MPLHGRDGRGPRMGALLPILPLEGKAARDEAHPFGWASRASGWITYWSRSSISSDFASSWTSGAVGLRGC